jgi:hypothetical protein
MEYPYVAPVMKEKICPVNVGHLCGNRRLELRLGTFRVPGLLDTPEIGAYSSVQIGGFDRGGDAR